MVCKQDPNLQLSQRRRILIFVIGAIESMLFCGAVFGWPQLVYILKEEGLFSELCTSSDGTLNNDNSNIINEFNSPKEFLQGLDKPLNISVSTNDGDSVNIRQFQSTEIQTSNVSGSDRCFGYNNMNSAGIGQISSEDSKWTGCASQDDRYALIYTLVIGCYSIPGVLIGYLLHMAGLRVTRIMACTLLSVSFICLGAATKDSPNVLFPAMIMMALGGNQLRMCGMQFGDLFPKYRSTAITLLSGVYAASASLFLLFKLSASVSIPREYVCWFLSGVCIILLLSSFIMPIHHIPINDGPVLARSDVKRIDVPLRDSLMTWSSFLHQYWFFISLFAMNNYQQSYNVWVTATACNNDEASLFSSLFSYSNLLTVFFAPMGGYLTDYLVAKARDKSNNEVEFRIKEIQANFIPLLGTSIAVTGMYFGLFFFHPVSIYLSLGAMIVARPCIIAISTAYLRIRFPVDHFNRLLGIYGTVTSALLLLQYPHFRWAQNMYYAAHGLSVALIVLSYSNPIHLLITPHIRAAVKKRDRFIGSDVAFNGDVVPLNDEKNDV